MTFDFKAYLRAFVRLAAISIPAAAIFWYFAAALLGGPGSLAGSVLMGLFFAIPFSMIMAIRLRRSKLEIPNWQAIKLERSLDEILAQVHYVPARSDQVPRVFRPSLKAGVLAGQVKAHVSAGRLTLEGPANVLNKLDKLLTTEE